MSTRDDFAKWARDEKSLDHKETNKRVPGFPDQYDDPFVQHLWDAYRAGRRAQIELTEKAKSAGRLLEVKS